jgi:hypothetical protein
MPQKLSKAASTLSKAMLFCADKAVGREVFDQVFSNDPLKNLDDMGCQRYRPVIGWVGFSVLLVDGCNKLQLEQLRDIT